MLVWTARRRASERLGDVWLPRHVRAISYLAGVPDRSTLEGTADFHHTETILDWYELTGLAMVSSRRRQWGKYRMSVVTLLPVGYGAAALVLVVGQSSLALVLSVLVPLFYTSVTYAELRDLRAHQGAYKNDAVAYGIAACGGVSCMQATTLARVTTGNAVDTEAISGLYAKWLDEQSLSSVERETVVALLGEYEGTLGELLETVRSLDNGR